MGSGCKIIRVKNLLGELLSIPGGISREEAVGEAKKHIEELREECVQAIPEEITALEDMIAMAGTDISASQLTDVLEVVDPLLTLAGTFGTAILDAVVKRFCDLCEGMREKGITSVEPLKVHLRAMRLVYSGELSEEENAEILTELSRIHDHYGIVKRPIKDEDFDRVPGELTNP